jgi:hypothetical protein
MAACRTVDNDSVIAGIFREGLPVPQESPLMLAAM